MIGDPVFTWRQMRPTATFLTPCDCSSTSPSDSTFCEATHSCKAGTTAPPPSPAGFKLHRGNKEQEAGDKSSVSNSVDIWRVKDDDGTCDAGLKGNLEGDYAEPFQFEMLLPFDTLRRWRIASLYPQFRASLYLRPVPLPSARGSPDELLSSVCRTSSS